MTDDETRNERLAKASEELAAKLGEFIGTNEWTVTVGALMTVLVHGIMYPDLNEGHLLWLDEYITNVHGLLRTRMAGRIVIVRIQQGNAPEAEPDPAPAPPDATPAPHTLH